MADNIALAIGYGIPESELWTMSPAAILRAIDAHAARHLDDLRLVDTMFASFKALFAASRGVSGVKRDDFLVLKKDGEEEQIREMTPDQILDRAFASLSGGE